MSTTDLECGAAGLLRLHYLLLPVEASAGRPPALCAKRVACAEELLTPLVAPPSGEGVAAGAGAPMAPAVAEAVARQLAAVPLSEQLDPLALSSRSGEVVEVRRRGGWAVLHWWGRCAGCGVRSTEVLKL